MKNFKVIYFLLPENELDENAFVVIRERKIRAHDYDSAWQQWLNAIEIEKINVDPVWQITELEEI